MEEEKSATEILNEAMEHNLYMKLMVTDMRADGFTDEEILQLL